MPSEDDWFIDWVLATPMTERARIRGIKQLKRFSRNALPVVVLPPQFKRLEVWQRVELIDHTEKYIKLLEDL